MNALLTLFALLICALVIFGIPPLVVPFKQDYGTVTVFDAAKAVLLCGAFAGVGGLLIYLQDFNRSFLLKLFVAALLIRLMVGATIFAFHGQAFFGGDALTYDYYGYINLKGWEGESYHKSVADSYIAGGTNPGWGMVYMVSAIYFLVGRNMLAVQFVAAVLGAATAPLVFLCAHHVFKNLRVARLAAFFVAFYPSLVLWSSQGLKDGPIVFFLAFSIMATLKLLDEFNVKHLIGLICAMFCLLSLRFYIFYMISAAVIGAFIISVQTPSGKRFLQQFIVIIMLGFALTYLGVTRYANLHFERFGSLERVQASRLDASKSAQSGFARDVDVSTTQGAISTVPIGLLYLLLAPFPWQLVSLRQSITIPEMVVWWGSVPLLLLGLWFSIRYRLRQISPILIFTVMLSLAYSIFQGNVGTAYRQRSQLLVFYFIFVAVGYVLVLEKREEKKRRQLG